jgi:uncharacterized repeat protein (TIGR01451 family)
MISQTHLALIRPSRLFLRSVVITLLLVSLLAAPVAGYISSRDAAWAEESAVPTGSNVMADLGTFPLSFIANAGQMDAAIPFQVRGMGADLYFAPRGVTLILPAAEASAYTAFHLRFVGANANPTISGEGLQPGVVNYLLGNDPSQWITDIPTYAGIMYEQLYPGISLHYNGSEEMLKGTYLVTPGANPDLIRWQYGGAARVQVDPATGNLVIFGLDSTGAEVPYLTELAPVAWQERGSERVPVEVRYILFENNTIGLALGSYDPASVLYLDPAIQFSTYFGGAGVDEGLGVAVDGFANVYITGQSNSVNLPEALNPPAPPFQPGLSGTSYDAFIAKYSMSARKLIYRTYLGGAGDDIGYAIAVDSGGYAYVTGETSSYGFPISSSGVYQSSYRGNTDAFVTKLNTTGSALEYSTYLGSEDFDRAKSIAIDGSGNAYVAGETSGASGDHPFPVVNALQGTYGGGGSDAFVTKLDSTGTSVTFSTFLGGGDIDRALGIAVSATGTVSVVGRTNSSNFPVANATQSYQGFGDAFVARFTTGGSPSFAFSTYLGGNDLDEANGVAIDSSNKTYVTGSTTSTDFPSTTITLPPSLGGGDHGGIDAFVTTYSPTGARAYSTYLGGSLNDKGAGIAVDSSLNIYVTGQTESTDFPYVSGFQEAGLLGLSDAFITKINVSGTSLDYSSFLGGGDVDLAYGIAVAGGGSVYLTGDTNSSDFPRSEGTYQHGGSVDAFILRIGSTSADIDVEKLDDIQSVSVGQNLPYTINVRNHGPDPSIVTMTDTLSLYMAFVSAETSQGTCAYDAGTRTVTCELGEMLPDNLVTIHLVLKVTSMPGTGLAFNQASVFGSEYDPNTLPYPAPNPNSYGQYTQVKKLADLEVIKLASSYRVRQNEPVVFSVQINNLGPGIATGVDLTDVLPAQVTYMSHVAPGTTTYNPVTGLWSVGSIPPNTTTTLTITAMVGNSPIGTIISNTAYNLHATETDPNLGNNASTIQLRVVTDYPEPGCHPSPTNPNEVICLSD